MRPHPNTIVGVLAIAFGLALALAWAPLDSETGIAFPQRGKFAIGDALAPTVAAFFFLVSGAMLAFGGKAPDAPRLTRANAAFLARAALLAGIGLLLMRYAGPLAALGQEGGYRPLRATAPWKHVGFVLGGAWLVAALASLVEGRATLRAALVGVGAALAIAALYDLPFEDLLLPPNGDV